MSSSRRVCVNTLCKATAASRLCGYLSNVLERWRQDVRHSDRLDRGGFTVLVALTVMILVTAALLTRTLSKLESVDLGLTAERLVLVDLSLPLKYADPTKHQQLLDESITRLPTESSISAVTPVNVPPFAG